MYKDKDKQREANRKAQAKFKAKGSTKQGITDRVLPDGNMDIETLAMVDAGCGDKLTHGLKRGKDIKTFADLPPDVQLAIKSLSMDETGYIDKVEKANRTAIAINFLQVFPGRYHSTGVCVGVAGVPGSCARGAERGR